MHEVILIASPPGFMVVDAEWTFPKSESEAKDELTDKDRIAKIFQVIFKQFEPAESIRESDFQISSEELFNKIKSHYPSESVSNQMIYEFMIEEGFSFETFPNKVEFVWLLKKRSNVL